MACLRPSSRRRRWPGRGSARRRNRPRRPRRTDAAMAADTGPLSPAYGEPPTGETPTGHTPLGHAPMDDTPTGQAPTAHTPTGHTPTGHAPMDHAPMDHAPEQFAAGDPRFFRRTGPHSLAAVVDAAGGEAPPRRLMFRGVAPLSTAQAADVGFLDNRKYLSALQKTQAGAVIVPPELADKVPPTSVAIISPEVYPSWARVAALFHPPPPLLPGVHPSAIVDAGARIDPSAEIGPLAVIGDRAVIGRRTRIAAHVVIGDGVQIGDDCRIGTHVSISHALLGDRVTLFPGVRI